MKRPFGSDSHAVSDEIATLAEWSRDQPRGGWSLGALLMLAQDCLYRAVKPYGHCVFGADYFDLERPDRPDREPRVTLCEAMARGWDGALFLEEQRWWRKHWIGMGWAEEVLAERSRR